MSATDSKFPLACDSFGPEEKAAINEVMQSGFYTMGARVKAYEAEFAQWVGTKHAIMVNSGSSANLLLISAMLTRFAHEAPLKKGDEVLVPALSWSTTVWPLTQLGLVPVFVDIDPKTMAISLESAQKALSAKTKAVFLIHVLGIAADMHGWKAFCEKNNLLLLEDCCESFGAFYNEKSVGGFGVGGTYSHFFSHHLTTIEGGMVVTNDLALADDMRSMRAHGWIRERSDRQELTEQFSHIDPRFLFIMPGYNLRPTDLQGALGTVQLKKMDQFLAAREYVARLASDAAAQFAPWLEVIGSEFLPVNKPADKYPEKHPTQAQRTSRRHSWMNIPIRVRPEALKSAPALKKIMTTLEESGVETRPIIAGNLAKHPGVKHIEHRVAGSLEQSDYLLQHGFMIGCHPNLPESSLQVLEKGFRLLTKLKAE